MYWLQQQRANENLGYQEYQFFFIKNPPLA